MLDKQPKLALNVDRRLVNATGALDLHKVFDEGDLTGILAACMEGLKVPFTSSIAVAGVTLLLAIAPR